MDGSFERYVKDVMTPYGLPGKTDVRLTGNAGDYFCGAALGLYTPNFDSGFYLKVEKPDEYRIKDVQKHEKDGYFQKINVHVLKYYNDSQADALPSKRVYRDDARKAG